MELQKQLDRDGPSLRRKHCRVEVMHLNYRVSVEEVKPTFLPADHQHQCL